jgi:hypothetical protein
MDCKTGMTAPRDVINGINNAGRREGDPVAGIIDSGRPVGYSAPEKGGYPFA